MKRVGILVGIIAAGIVVVVMASSTGQEVLAEASPSVELRHVTRWMCAVRHAKTQNDYKCTKRDEKKSCLCAIQKCKHWNPGHERHCTRACRCTKK
jgi:CDP-diacylglycerol pyrophosphatase